jgi:hypothetical protein
VNDEMMQQPGGMAQSQGVPGVNPGDDHWTGVPATA